MAEKFGYKSEYYELSMDVSERLYDQLADQDKRTLVARGISVSSR